MAIAAAVGALAGGCEGPPAPQPPHATVTLADFNVASSERGYAAYRAEGFRPRDDRPGVQLVLPLDWAMDPFADRNWRYQLHAWRMLDPIWDELLRTGDARLADEALAFVRDWHRAHVVEGLRSEFQWYDMATGIRAQHLALILELERWGRLELAVADREIVLELARLHIDRLRDADFIATNNHGVFQIHGLRLLCNALGEAATCRGEEAYSAAQIASLLERQFDERGVHRENSPSYHLLALDVFARIRPALYPSARPEPFARLALGRELAPWFTLPDGRIAELGDSAGTGARFPAGADPPCQRTTAAGTCIVSRDLAASGYVIVRSHPAVAADAASMLIVTGAAFETDHDHADELSFELFAAGARIIQDAGKYGYEEDAWAAWFESDLAHNVVTLAGASFGPRDTGRRGSALEGLRPGADVFTIRGAVRRGDRLEHARTLRYRPERDLEIIDDVTAAADARPVVLFHLPLAIEARVEDRAVVLRRQERGHVARIVVAEGACEPTLVRGRREPRQGWVSTGYLATAAATVVELTCAPGTRRIRTRIELGGDGTL